MKDRFTEATNELTEKNPYVCDSCTMQFGHPTVERFEETREGRGHDGIATGGAECILNCDPMPFGD